MPRRPHADKPPIEPREFRSVDEIDRGINKLQRRSEEVRNLDARAAILEHSGADDVVRSNIKETIRDVFGPNSPEFQEHEHIHIWAGPANIGMSGEAVVEGTERGKIHVLAILQGLVDRLQERREEIVDDTTPSPTRYFEQLNLHPRIAEVANDLYLDGYHWEAVFAASKALINYVKERSGLHDLDGASLMRSAFSRNKPVLAFSDLTDQTDEDEQEGMMHLFEGVVLAVRNPGGHSFPEGSEQRALEYISLLSLLAYRVQEARKVARR